MLVEVDFPHTKKLSPEQKKANDELLAKYKIEGFPTVIVLNGEGKNVTTGESFGYAEGGPKAWIAEFEKHVKKS